VDDDKPNTLHTAKYVTKIIDKQIN